MKVKALVLKGYRGFCYLRLNIDPRLTVIVGENGVGKTSVLDALAMLLDTYVKELIKPGQVEEFRESDVNIQAKCAEVTVEVKFDDSPVEIIWGRERKHTGDIVFTTSPIGRGLEQLKKRIKRRVDVTESETLMVYYGQERSLLGVASPHMAFMSENVGGREAKQGSEAAFDLSARMRFADLAPWFRDRSLEEAQHWQDDPSYRDRALEALRQAMTQATNLSEPRYEFGKGRETGEGLYVTKAGTRLHTSQLSHGEQTYLALAGDLARRLAMLNPNAEDPLAAPGIVLIDEIELHLHPHWQRQIIPWLMETFTNCQFVITTHSPQVLGRVHADNIRVLKQENGRVEVFTVTASHGRDSNYILVSVLGGDERDVDIKAKFMALDQAIAQSDLARARILLAELRDNIEGGAPELAIAEHRLERKLRGRQE